MNTTRTNNNTMRDGNGRTRHGLTLFATALAAILMLATTVVLAAETPVDGLTAAEERGILLMREEEKLARDVYLALYEQWSLPVLRNIARSEQTHMDAMKTLLDRYGLEDPAADDVRGVFTDARVQSLYDELTAAGQDSLTDALTTGARIEELDIADLNRLLAETDNPEIETIYQNLVKGSRNHLRSFTSQLAGRGEMFQPEYISEQLYRDIVTSPQERGPYTR